MSDIEEFRARFEEARMADKPVKLIDLIYDIDDALAEAVGDKKALEDLKIECGVEAFSLERMVKAGARALEAEEDARVAAEREHEARLAEAAARQAESTSASNKWEAERAQSHANRAASDLNREKARRNGNVAVSAILVLGVLAVLYTFWFFLHGPSASEQLEDKFRQSCIDKGWSYNVDSNDDSLGTDHGDCEKPYQ